MKRLDCDNLRDQPERMGLPNVHDMFAHGEGGRKRPLHLVMAALLALGLAGCVDAGGDALRLSLNAPEDAAGMNGGGGKGGMADASPSTTFTASNSTEAASHDPRAALVVAAPLEKAVPGPLKPSASPRTVGKDAGASTSPLAELKRRIDKAFTPSGPSTAERQQLGDALAKKVLASARQSQDAALRARLQRIVDRLAVAAREESPWPRRWKVYVIDDARADAFTAGGGYLFITTGMIRLLETDERLATVLAHEMAHNLLRHVWEAREKKEMARKAHEFSSEVLAKKWRMPWLGQSVSFVVNTSLNTYSRQQEYDADAEGLHLLVRAGYRPQVALETFDYLRRHFRDEGVVKNFFYNHHPLYERRRWYLANRIRAHYRAEAGLPPVRHSNWRGRR